MKKLQNKIIIAFFSTLLLVFGATAIAAQTDPTPKKRLKSPAIVKGYIGGEAHDSYVIRVRKGQTLTIRISWLQNNKNRAEFSVSRSANFFNGESVKFGKISQNGKQWRGKIPKTGNYYIYVVAHPSANYTLNVSVR